MSTIVGILRMTRYLLSAFAPSGYLPAWEDLPAYDRLSNELANRRANHN